MTTHAMPFAGCHISAHGHHPRRRAWTEARVTVQIAGDDVDVECRAHTYLERDERNELTARVDGHAEALVDGVWRCADEATDSIDDITEALQDAALEDAGCPS